MKETQQHFCNIPAKEEELESKYKEMSDGCYSNDILQDNLDFHPWICQGHEMKVS